METADYDKKTTAEASETAENYLKEHYQDIESVEIEKVFRSPMGGMKVNGTVNNQFNFSLGLEESDFSIRGNATGEGFPDRKEDYDLATREQAAAVAESYLRNNYQDIETVEYNRFYSISESENMEIIGDVNTYGFMLILNESTFEVEEIEIYSSTEGLNSPYEKPERKEECLDVDCDY